MRGLRAIVLFGVAMTLAYIAGWGMPGTELSGPAAVASLAAFGMAVA
jgi:hypothetical protein